MNDVQFFEEKQYTQPEQKGAKMVGWLIDKGIAKDKRQAEIVLIVTIVVILVAAVFFFFRAGGGNEPSDTIEILPTESVGSISR